MKKTEKGGSKRKPTAKPDDLIKAGKSAEVQLTEDELKKVSGGVHKSWIDI